MAKIELSISNRSHPGAIVSLTLEIFASQQPLEFTKSGMKFNFDMNAPVSPEFPYLTFRAIESACISGALYARRKLKIPGLAVDLASFSIEGEVKNAEPFAIATMIAACNALSNDISFSGEELKGWRIVDSSN